MPGLISHSRIVRLVDPLYDNSRGTPERGGRERDGVSGVACRALSGSNDNGSAWPGPVLRYLYRAMPAQSMLEAASDKLQKTEAHVFLALDLLNPGSRNGPSSTCAGHAITVRRVPLPPTSPGSSLRDLEPENPASATQVRAKPGIPTARQ